MRGLLLAAMTEAALVTWRDVSSAKVLPMPSDYAAVAIFYGGLGLLPAQAEGFASLVGWGMVLATFLKLWDPTNPTKLVLPGKSPQVSGGVQTAGANAAATASATATAVGTPAAPTFATRNPAGGNYPVKAQ